ncbi:MAG: glycosyltransferase [Betaproteobacteria bacterium]|jgi:glycosyltransferase involved in cell wall biosynthesis|nr:glycosyltransferase family 4 protein [Pseudomonadota bacterium]NBP38140.1 glycosyltransferase [Betaproteobacteria bacterium]NBT82689.1 glycosyltransferase [Betaproteobacteria bacterium]NBY53747.1 glycosyltransferase [Betaproteobacteria bacterium]
MTAAIYYHPEAYTTKGPKLMGRNAAGESFLRGFFSYSKAQTFWVQVQKPEHARYFAQTAECFGRSEAVKAVDKQSLVALSQVGAIYFPGPGIGEHAFHRAAYGHGAWSLCGITHTTSSAGAMDALAALITSPVQPWDAVICTSSAVKNNVERLLQAQVDYLSDRLGISKLVLPRLPVIPLGIHTKDFVYSETVKSQARTSLGAGPETIVLLFMGRLSFHAKAHPLAMYQAVQHAVAVTGKDVVLLECGWHANEFIRQAYAEAAQQACPDVRVLTLDGRKQEDRQTAWAGADLCCSLSDNIQETFGIVPLEAMASGLPVVVSDWDGYKDTVREGIDGFRIPTFMPQAELGSDLALRHALEIDSYDMYCGHSCSLIAVDVDATAQALIRLFESPELRRQLGQSGRTRARELYDWAVIIPRYEDLWSELNEIRKAQASGLKQLPRPWPARMDPFYAFAAYPTRSLTEQTLLRLSDGDSEKALQRTLAYRRLAMVDFAKAILPSEEEIRLVLASAHRQKSEPWSAARSAAQWVELIPEPRRPYVFRTLAWFVKLGVLTVLP